VKQANDVLTWREGLVFRFIDGYMTEHGYAPTTREIGTASGLASTSSVYYVLTSLEAKGFIVHVKGRKGGIAVNPERAERVNVSRADLIRVLSEAEGFIGSKDNKAFTRLAEAAGVA
jgi:SOS-response transcriptional repressor LexA